MSETAILAHNISKKFRLFNSPHERLMEALHPFNKKYHKEFWALKNINLNIPQGSTIGIIGRNGSGKSTLLHIICSILRPTTGTVYTNGRISTLLAMGAGFNPEFSGRDNVLLNGTLMGFTKEEMKERLPVIESFADIGEFFDQPVKIYSSGMFVRVAFAAAINIDPDILVIDEVLAVGDAKFQHKCYQKILGFQAAGKTCVFVTHSNDSVTKHCDHAILLEKGEIVESGHPNNVVNAYNKLLFGETMFINDTVCKQVPTAQQSPPAESEADHSELEKFLGSAPQADNFHLRRSYNKNEFQFGSKMLEILDFLIVSPNGYDPVALTCGDVTDIYFKALAHQTIKSPIVGFNIKTKDGVVVYGNNTLYMEVPTSPVESQRWVVFKFSVKMDLADGDHFVSLGIAEKIEGEFKMHHARYDSIHLVMEGNKKMGGLCCLATKFEEISRNVVNADLQLKTP